MIAFVAVTDRLGRTLYPNTSTPSIPLEIRATWDPAQVPLMANDAPPDPNNPIAWLPKWFFASGIALMERLGATQFASMNAAMQPPGPAPSCADPICCRWRTRRRSRHHLANERCFGARISAWIVGEMVDDSGCPSGNLIRVTSSGTKCAAGRIRRLRRHREVAMAQSKTIKELARIERGEHGQLRIDLVEPDGTRSARYRFATTSGQMVVATSSSQPKTGVTISRAAN